MNFPNTSILDPDNGPTGFVTDDFQFAAIPFGKKYIIIADGQQLEVVKNRQLAEIRLEQLKNSHRKLKKRTTTPRSQKSQKNAKPSSGPKGSQGPNPVAARGSTAKPKSKSGPIKKPASLHPNPLLDALS